MRKLKPKPKTNAEPTPQQPPSRLRALAATISEQTAVLDRYLVDNHIPEPTFDTYQPDLDSPFPPEIERARLLLRECTLELHELTLGPRAHVQDLILRDSASFLDVIYRFRIAQRVPLDSPSGISYASLAAQIGVPTSSLKHVLRLAIAHRVFAEPRPDAVAHNALSAAILEIPSLHDWVGLAAQEILPMLGGIGAAIETFPNADEPCQAAGSCLAPLASPSSPGDSSPQRMSFYESLSLSPSRAARFASAMTFHAQSGGYGMRHLVSGFDWGSLPEGATVVDLGGSRGEVARAVTAEFPGLRFVVQDLPATIEGAGKGDLQGDGEMGPEKCGRVQFMAHDFFAPQPVVGAEVYLFRWVMHNWPDGYCVRILRALVPALREGAKVLVVDDVLPAFGENGWVEERRGRMLDAVMMALGNAREREEGEFRALFVEADERFRYVGLTVPEGSQMGVMEVVWEP